MLKICWIWKIEINRRIPNSPLPTLGLSFGVVHCLVLFPTHFNPNNSPLILLQISLLFTNTPALSTMVQFFICTATEEISAFYKSSCPYYHKENLVSRYLPVLVGILHVFVR